MVADYVPFYFTPRSPTLFTICRGGVPTYDEGADPLVFLVTDIPTVRRPGLEFVFGDGNCAQRLTEFFTDLADLDKVDWDLMGRRMWRDTEEDPDRKRRRAAEFLVHRKVPWEAILEIGVRTSTMERVVRGELGGLGVELPVRVKPGWYY